MQNPINNEYLENLALKLAGAIKTEDAEYYAHLMSHSAKFLENLKRWELIAFSDRVHFLAAK